MRKEKVGEFLNALRDAFAPHERERPLHNALWDIFNALDDGTLKNGITYDRLEKKLTDIASGMQEGTPPSLVNRAVNIVLKAAEAFEADEAFSDTAHPMHGFLVHARDVLAKRPIIMPEDQPTKDNQETLLLALARDSSIKADIPATEMRAKIEALFAANEWLAKTIEVTRRNAVIGFFITEKLKFEKLASNAPAQAPVIKPDSALERGPLLYALNRLTGLTPEEGGVYDVVGLRDFVTDLRNAPYVNADVFIRTFNDRYDGHPNAAHDKGVVAATWDTFARTAKTIAPAKVDKTKAFSL